MRPRYSRRSKGWESRGTSKTLKSPVSGSKRAICDVVNSVIQNEPSERRRIFAGKLPWKGKGH